MADEKRHTHPGGVGAMLGVRLARYSGWQGLSLLITNILHYGSIAVVARFLGPSPLGSYALLFFLTGVITQIIHVVTKPGTMRRTFGGGDEEDDIEDDEGDDDEDRAKKYLDQEISDQPKFTLGVGLIWTISLIVLSVGTVFLFRYQISEFLLGDRGQADAVVFATIAGSVWALMKLGQMVLWFEGRPLAYTIVDTGRPFLNLVAIVVILSMGAGVKGAVIGQAIGTTSITIICMILLWGSFDFGWSFRELGQILRRGAIRIPIATSMWIIQNSDSFILSRFVDHKQLGLYNLASRTGFMVQFLPQGFRMALRPMRKTTAWMAYKETYGTAVANGQMMAYFLLIALTAILAMVLGGEILLEVGGSKFQSVAPLVPLTAAAMSMPALYRSMGQFGNYKKKKLTFILSTMFAAATYIGWSILLLSGTNIGIYGAPIALILAFGIPGILMFVRAQTGKKPMDFPYLRMAEATAVATTIAVTYHLFHPHNKWVQLPLIALCMLLWFASLPALRIIPKAHWQPLAHIFKSFFKGSALQFNPAEALQALSPDDRLALHTAVVDRIPPAQLVGADGGREGERLIDLLRRAGEREGIPVPAASEQDAEISLYLFSNEPVAVRLAHMRSALAAGAEAADLQTLEDLVQKLGTARDRAWALDGKLEKKRRRQRGTRPKPRAATRA